MKILLDKRILKSISEYVFWLIIGISLLLGMRWYGLSNNQFLFMIIIVIIAFGLHFNGIKKDSEYTRKKIIGNITSKRTYEYDWLRVLAVCMVILTHAIQGDISSNIISNEKTVYVFTVLYVFFLSCNLLYVMLSGALLFPYKEEKISDFFLRRISKVLLPMIVYFGIYLWLYGEFENTTFETIKNMLLRIFSGNTSVEAPHFWLMYVILSIYVVVPFFRYMFQHMPYKVLSAMVIVSLFFMILSTYLSANSAVTTFLSSWIGVAIIGYWMTQKETRRYDKVILLFGIIGLIITMIIIKSGRDFTNLCCGCSPTMTMIACGLFSLTYLCPKIFSKGNIILNIISKYSYSIILIHWICVFQITKNMFGIYTNQYCYIGGIILTLVVTLAVSLFVGFLIDNVIVIVIDWIYNCIIKIVTKIGQKIYILHSKNNL